MENVFTLILSKFRLYQGIVLYRTLMHNTEHFILFILCVDDEAYSILSLLSLKNVVLISKKEIETEDIIKKFEDKMLNEKCWTLKPVLIEKVFEEYKYNRVTHLDADLCFFSNPNIIFRNQSDCAVLLSPHDFPTNEYFKTIEKKCGIYNSGFISFKNDNNGRACLSWWKKNCFIWCYDRCSEDGFGDQKYLDKMPKLFQNVCDINTEGVNIAPWNHNKYKFHIKQSRIFVNRYPLIFYHFCGFRVLSRDEFALTFDSLYVEQIHFPYIALIKNAIDDVRRINPSFNGFFIEDLRKSNAKIIRINN